MKINLNIVGCEYDEMIIKFISDIQDEVYRLSKKLSAQIHWRLEQKKEGERYILGVSSLPIKKMEDTRLKIEVFAVDCETNTYRVFLSSEELKNPDNWVKTITQELIKTFV